MGLARILLLLLVALCSVPDTTVLAELAAFSTHKEVVATASPRIDTANPLAEESQQELKVKTLLSSTTNNARVAAEPFDEDSNRHLTKRPTIFDSDGPGTSQGTNEK